MPPTNSLNFAIGSLSSTRPAVTEKREIYPNLFKVEARPLAGWMNLQRPAKICKLQQSFRLSGATSSRSRRAKGHVLLEIGMFRPLSVFGIACLALAVCAWFKNPLQARPQLPTKKNSNDDENRLLEYPGCLLARGFDSQFSIN
jgi:hypothetical protein